MRFALNDLCLSLPRFFHLCTRRLQVIIAASKIPCGQNALVILLPIIIDGVASFFFAFSFPSLYFGTSLSLFLPLFHVTEKDWNTDHLNTDRELKNQSQCKWRVEAKQSHGRSNKEQRLSTVTYSSCVVTVEPLGHLSRLRHGERERERERERKAVSNTIITCALIPHVSFFVGREKTQSNQSKTQQLQLCVLTCSCAC